jgi:hypothetical protein
VAESDDNGRHSAASGPPRNTRRLSDKILVAFHSACDQSEYEIAEQLLRILETLTTRRPMMPEGGRRRSLDVLVAAYERLWNLRNPGAGDG